MKLLPVKQADDTASARPIQNSLLASSGEARVHNVVVEIFSVVLTGNNEGVVVITGDNEVFVAMVGRIVVLFLNYVFGNVHV